MKTVSAAAPPKPAPSRPIKSFKQPAPAPRPPHLSSNELVDEALRIASSPGGIDPRQQRY